MPDLVQGKDQRQDFPDTVAFLNLLCKAAPRAEGITDTAANALAPNSGTHRLNLRVTPCCTSQGLASAHMLVQTY